MAGSGLLATLSVLLLSATALAQTSLPVSHLVPATVKIQACLIPLEMCCVHTPQYMILCYERDRTAETFPRRPLIKDKSHDASHCNRALSIRTRPLVVDAFACKCRAAPQFLPAWASHLHHRYVDLSCFILEAERTMMTKCK